MTPWLAGLGLDGASDSILRTVSYLAERYLVATNGALVLEPVPAADES